MFCDMCGKKRKYIWDYSVGGAFTVCQKCHITAPIIAKIPVVGRIVAKRRFRKLMNRPVRWEEI